MFGLFIGSRFANLPLDYRQFGLRTAHSSYKFMFAFFTGSQFANLLETNAALREATPDEPGETQECAILKDDEDACAFTNDLYVPVGVRQAGYPSVHR